MRAAMIVSLSLVACVPADDAPEDPPPCPSDPGTVCPYAGVGRAGFNGDGVHRLDATLYFPMDIEISELGPPVLADWNNHRLRLVEDDDTLTTIMGTDFIGDGDPDKLDATVIGALGTDVDLNHPTQQRYLPDGRLLSASWHTHKLRTWDPATGLVHVLAGSTPDFVGDNMADLAEARFNQPVSIEIDRDGNVIVVDMRNERIRFVDMVARRITTIAGSGEQGYCGDGGPGREACFGFPRSENPEPGGAVALSPDGSLLYVADTENHVVRVLDMQGRGISLYAGAPQEPGDVDGPVADARFNFPRDLEMSPDGILFVADSDNHKVRAIDTVSGTVSTFAGTGSPTCPGDALLAVPRVCDAQATAGDGGDALEADLYRPFGVALDLDGNVVIADTFNHRLRVVYR
jgi:DNA-binding beta-propeller fold protein YncE